jgi:hypothetical protein
VDQTFNSAHIKQQLLHKTHTDCVLSTTSSIFFFPKGQLTSSTNLCKSFSGMIFWSFTLLFTEEGFYGTVSASWGSVEEDEGLEFKTSDAAHCPT